MVSHPYSYLKYNRFHIVGWFLSKPIGFARCVMVMIIRRKLACLSSKPERSCLYFIQSQYPYKTRINSTILLPFIVKYRVPPPPPNTHKLSFITFTKINQNNSNFVHSKIWTCWWILWSQFFMHRIYFISWKKEKVRIKFMNFNQKYMGSDFLGGHPVVGQTWHFKLNISTA